MGEEQSKVQGRSHSEQHLTSRLVQNLTDYRLRLSHQANIFQLLTFLSEHYSQRSISELYLQRYDSRGGASGPEQYKFLERCAASEGAESESQRYRLRQSEIFSGRAPEQPDDALPRQIVRDADHNQIASDGCYYLSKTKLAKLQTLDLSYNLLNDYAAGHLATSSLPSLVNLIVSNNKLTFKGVTLFGKAEWPSLGFLQVKDNDFEPTKEMENVEFRTEVKMFRLELQ